MTVCFGQYPTNGSFENGLTGWSVASGSAGTAAVIMPDTSLIPDGTHAVELSTTAHGTTTLTQTLGTVSAGSTYVLEPYQILGPSTSYMNYQVQLLAGNTVIPTITVVNPQTGAQPDTNPQSGAGADGDWMGVELSATVAVGSSLASEPLTIQLTAIGQGNAGSMLFDDVKLSQWITSPQAGTTSTLTMPQFGFQGMRWDSAVGLYDDNARYYDPTTGRFLSNDPAGQGTNLYEFDGNDPVDNTDPTGQFFTAGSGTFANNSGLPTYSFLNPSNVSASPATGQSDYASSTSSFGSLSQYYDGQQLGSTASPAVEPPNPSQFLTSPWSLFTPGNPNLGLAGVLPDSTNYSSAIASAYQGNDEPNPQDNPDVAIADHEAAVYAYNYSPVMEGLGAAGDVAGEVLPFVFGMGEVGVAEDVAEVAEGAELGESIGLLGTSTAEEAELTLGEAVLDGRAGDAIAGEASVPLAFGEAPGTYDGILPELENGLPSNSLQLEAAENTPIPMGGRAIGEISGREFDPDLAGGPIESLTTEGVQITNEGIDGVEQHLARFGPDEQNQAMVARLRSIADGTLEPMDYDLNFYTHELREAVRYNNLGWPTGQPADPDAAYELWNNAHTATLEDYGLNGGQLYHPDTLP